MKIMQIVGYKNSGKTTLINDLIKICQEYQLSVSTIKHHGHGTQDISLNHKEVDSLSFINNGAEESIVLGNELIERVTKVHRSLTEIINKDLSIQADILLIEGFKSEDYPKVVLGENTDNLNDKLSNVVYNCNAYNQDERKLFLDWFKKWLFQKE